VTLTASVVIATYNRPAELQRLLHSLAEQTVMPAEVIVVDDGSHQPAAPEAPVGLPLRVIRQANGGAGSARHTGIDAATGDVIVVVDDDMTVNPEFVAQHLGQHEGGAQVVQGRFFNSEPAGGRPLFDRFIAQQQSDYFDRCAADASNVLPARFSTGNVSFRRDFYHQVGGFDRSLRFREDSELGIRFAAHGARFGFADRAVATHDEPVETLRRWLDVAERYGEAEVAMHARHPDVVQPDALLQGLPAPARVLIGAARKLPATMRPLARVVSAVAAVTAKVGMRGPAVKMYAMAYALSWFRGVARARTTGATPMVHHEAGQRQRVWFGKVGTGVGVDVVTMQQAVDRIIDLAKAAPQRGPAVVVTPNVDHLVLHRTHPRLAAVYRRAELVLADGMPMVMLTKLLRLPLRDKVSGSDLIDPLVAAAAAADVPLFFLGASDEVTEQSAERMCAAHPTLRVVGRRSPMFDIDGGVGGNPAIAEALREAGDAGARLVLLAFGAPKQESLFHDFEAHLPPAVYVCCGASLDFVAGKVSRAPRWMSRIGAEWLYRLAKEPGRLWKRYLVRDIAALPVFMAMVGQRLTGRRMVTLEPMFADTTDTEPAR
jgi:N-acetylglucosaminyldiphosphoundecaprenol N-acetyl-beta-D-mannosaminyltransferase